MAAMTTKVRRRLLTPAMVPIGVAIAVAILIIGVGESLLGFVDANATSEMARPELYFALGLAVLIIGGGAFIATRPRGSLGVLDREVLLGERPFFAPEPPPVDVAARRGAIGTLADAREGDMIYAQNGPLARLIGVLPGEEDFGRRRRGFLYAHGVYGASDELWIPVEAILAVHPETHSIFLAIKGDETEHFGWSRAPQSFRRATHQSHFPSAH